MDKLITLLVLVMLGYFAIRSMLKPASRPADKKGPPRPDRAPSSEKQEGDYMAQDPICGAYVDPASAFDLEHQGQTIYFCSELCRFKFLDGDR